MLSDQGADLVMAEIERLTDRLTYDYWSDADRATANAMLNHLTELHQLRDFDLFLEMVNLTNSSDRATMNQLYLLFEGQTWEEQYDA